LMSHQNKHDRGERNQHPSVAGLATEFVLAHVGSLDNEEQRLVHHIV
jgi:hypothetical protein